MLKYVAIFPSKVGGGHTPLSLSCYTTLLLVELETETSYISCSYRKKSATCSTHESGSGI